MTPKVCTLKSASAAASSNFTNILSSFIRNNGVIMVSLLLSLAVSAIANEIPEDSPSPTFACNGECDPSFEVCNADLNICEHKPVFPLFRIEFIGSLVTIIAMAAANAGSIGGGGLLIPICIVFFSFDTLEAIPISNFNIFCSSIIRYYLGINDHHPLRKERSQVDFSAAMICLPTVLFGTFLGVQLKKVVPSGILVILITAFTSYVTYTTGKKGYKLYAAETVKFTKEKASLGDSSISPRIMNNGEKSQPLMQMLNIDFDNQGGDSPPPVRNTVKTPGVAEMEDKDWMNNRALKEILEDESSIFPLRKMKYSLMLFGIMVFVSLLRPSAHHHVSLLGVAKCSPVDWFLIFAFPLVCFWFSYISGKELMKEQQIKIDNNYEFLVTDIQWNNSTIQYFSIRCILGGLIAGLLGIGGATIFNPLLLDAGFPPEVTTTTSMFMVIFSSAAATIQFMFAGDLNMGFSFWIGLFNAVGTVWGLLQIKKLVKDTGRSSYLIIFLAVAVAITMIVMPIFGFTRALIEEKNGKSMFGFNPFC